jgi:hypothetical protein
MMKCIPKIIFLPIGKSLKKGEKLFMYRTLKGSKIYDA